MQIIIFISIIIILAIYAIKIKIDSAIIEKSFISIVNHSFRTPLTRIKWMSDSLDPDMPRLEQQEITKNISNTTNYILGIIDMLAGMKDINNTATQTFKTISMREIIEDGISKFNNSINEKRIQLRVPAFSNLPLLTVDTKKISFSIHAMLENAIFYSHYEGIVNIEAKLDENKIILAISDNGMGMTWKDRRNVFKKFYRSEDAVKMNTDGMGISLYISKKIIENHKGTIEAKSEGKNKGSTFLITLPI